MPKTPSETYADKAYQPTKVGPSAAFAEALSVPAVAPAPRPRRRATTAAPSDANIVQFLNAPIAPPPRSTAPSGGSERQPARTADETAPSTRAPGVSTAAVGLPVYPLPSVAQSQTAVNKYREQGNLLGAHDAAMRSTGLPEGDYTTGQEWYDDIYEKAIGGLSWLGTNAQVPWAVAVKGAAHLGEAVLPERGVVVDAASGLAGAVINASNPFAPGTSDQWGEMFKNLYDAFESGRLREKTARQGGGDLPFIETDWSSPKIDGIDIVDMVAPKELINRMIESSEGLESAFANTWRYWNTDDGRIMLGVGLEMVTDPLNMVGKATRGVSFAARNGDTFILAPMAEKAANAAAVARGGEDAPRFLDEARNAVVSLETAADDAEDARKYLLESAKRLAGLAEEEAITAKMFRTAAEAPTPDEAARLIEAERDLARVDVANVTASGADTKQIARIEREADRLEALAQMARSGEHVKALAQMATKHDGTSAAYLVNARRLREFAEGTTKLRGGVTKKGGLAWHLPGSERTRFLLGKPVMGYPKAGVARVRGWFDDVSESGAAIRRRVEGGELDLAGLTPSQRFAYASDALIGRPVTIAAQTFDMFHVAFGDRFYRPLLASKSLQAATEVFSRPANLLLKKVPDSLWQAYQGALERWMFRAHKGEATISSMVHSFTRAARTTWKQRRRDAPGLAAEAEKALAAATDDVARATARRELDLAKRWMSNNYSVQSVLDEAAEAVDTGQGILRGELKRQLDPLARQLAGLATRVAETYGADIAEVEQAALAIARHAKGGLDEYNALTKAMRESVESGALDPLAPWQAELSMMFDGKHPTKDIINHLLGAVNANDPTKLIRNEASGQLKKLLDKAKPKLEFDLQMSKDWYKPRSMQDTLNGKAPAADVDGYLRQWEVDLWRDVKAIQEAGEHPDTHMIMAAMVALKNSPSPGSPDYGRMLALYGQVVGTRFGDLPADLEPVVVELRRILLSYEDAYERAGVPWVKHQIDRLRDLGVIDYVPHMAADIVSIASGSKTRAMMGDAREVLSTAFKKGPGLDSQFSASIAAEKKRRMPGSLGEINSWQRTLKGHAEEAKWLGGRLAEDGVVKLTMDPMLLLGRYQAANRMLNAIEMLAEMHDGGVIKMFADKQAAIDGGFVPLFVAREAQRDSLFLSAPRDTLRAAAEKGELVARVRQRMMSGDADVSIFGDWGGVNKDLAKSLLVEDALVYSRVALEAGGPTVDGMRLADPLLARGTVDGALDFDTMWEVALEVSGDNADDAARMMANTVNRLIVDTGIKVAPEWMKPQAWREPTSMLFAPAQVVESMTSIFGDGSMPGGLLSGMHAMSNFWKERLTSVRIMFSVRNFMSNKFTEAMDRGVMAMLNPHTNILAAKITTASMVADTFGGGDLELALEVISKFEKVTGDGVVSGAAAINENMTRAAARAAVKATGTDRLSKIAKQMGWTKARLIENLGESVDIGDGINRSWNEVLSVVRDNGVINFQYGAGQIDVALAERSLLDNLTGKNSIDVAKGVASLMEDAVVTMAPMVIGGAPIALPKAWGAKLAQAIENQARVGTFISHVKAHGSITSAATEVNRLLFNYGDLTHFQKRYLRALIPFFTWDFKNTNLLLEKMAENPAYFAAMDRLFMDDIPGAAGHATGEDGRLERMPWSENTFSVSLPDLEADGFEFSRQRMVGLGHPIEALASNLSLASSLADTGGSTYEKNETGKVMAKMHFGIKAAYEFMYKEDSFTGRPLANIEPRKTTYMLDAAARVERKTRETAAALGFANEIAPAAAQYLAHEVVGIRQHRRLDGSVALTAGETGNLVEWAVGASPYSADINSAMAFQSFAGITPLGDGLYRTRTDDSPYFLRLLSAWSALKLDTTDAEMARSIREGKMLEGMEAEQKARKVPVR